MKTSFMNFLKDKFYIRQWTIHFPFFDITEFSLKNYLFTLLIPLLIKSDTPHLEYVDKIFILNFFVVVVIISFDSFSNGETVIKLSNVNTYIKFVFIKFLQVPKFKLKKNPINSLHET